VIDHDVTGRGDLLRSLGAWLEHNGQWDAAAAALGVHRHTLRHRMRRVGELLGRDLDVTAVRMELWAGVQLLQARRDGSAPSL
jgi:PucR family transcriptional regulator, purine catabolism regulatory protein